MAGGATGAGERVLADGRHSVTRGSFWVGRRSGFFHRTLAALVVGGGLLAAAGPAAAKPVGWRVHSYIVEDARTGAVVEAFNADERAYPASLAKLMTLYITFHRLATGRLTLSERLPVSYHAAVQPPTKLHLRPGTTISVRSAILGITVRSANDAAVVLAEAIGGTEAGFVGMMNHTAQRLGMTRTTFRNASGLPALGQGTTAHDMATLAIALIRQYPQYYHYFGRNSFDFRGRTVTGFDFLLNEYPGVDGMKTGYTYASGYNLVTSAVRDGRRLVGVVMGRSTADSCDRLMEVLLDRGFKLAPAGTVAAEAEGTVGGSIPAARASDAPRTGTERSPTSRAIFDWLVQLGAIFRSPWPVRQVLSSALRTDPGNLKSADPIVVKLSRGGYLARFANLTGAQAREACQVLRGRRFTCSVLRVPETE